MAVRRQPLVADKVARPGELHNKLRKIGAGALRLCRARDVVNNRYDPTIADSGGRILEHFEQ